MLIWVPVKRRRALPASNPSGNSRRRKLARTIRISRFHGAAEGLRYNGPLNSMN